VNGVKAQDRILKIGDTIAFHNVLVQLIQDTGHGFAEMSPGIASELHSQNPTSNFSLENLLMPPLYKLNEFYPTKNLIAALMIIFALVVTFLSTVPMTELMKASIQKEASRRALSIARQLADASERALAMASESTVRTDFAESEDGVIGALVVAKEDGHIIAPLSKAQSYSNDEFVARARKHDEIFIDKNSSASIGVSVPVRMYSPETGQQLIVAYAVVSYKLNALDWGAVVGLFARVLILSLILAYVFYAMIYHLVTYPLRTTSQQLDKVLRGEASTINSNFEFGTFKRLVNDINSALARIQPHQDMLAINPSFDTSVEGANLIRILKDAAICLSKDCNNKHN
jgi:hypothetical protein